MKRSFWILMAFLILMSSGTCTRPPLEEDAMVQVLGIYPAVEEGEFVIPAIKSVYDARNYNYSDTLLFIRTDSEAGILRAPGKPLAYRPNINNLYRLPNGNFLFSGNISDDSYSYYNTLREISPEGLDIRQQNFPDRISSVCPANDGNMFYFGYELRDTLPNAFLYMKKNLAGDTLWTRSLDVGARYHNIESGTPTADNGCIALGNIWTQDRSNDMFAVRITADGDTLWTGRYGGDRVDYLRHALELPDASSLLMGTIALYDSSNFDWSLSYGEQVYLVRVSSGGQKIWTLPVGKTLRESSNSLIRHSGGNYILAGNRDESYAYLFDEPVAWVAAISPDAELLWMREFDSRISNGILELPSGEILFLSSVVSGTYYYDYLHYFYITKISSSGTVVWDRTLTP
ncbi:MAG: hypothetical protein PHX07_08290 [Candidatus Marinimicrobia bacterium]|jgi:hypothetical protein|nr:hypothetical protein [Candidatus Neomarinimicrobiota bacterium]MDD4962219.1 hypothetical protein [Candidatus Neomarinimicrobiota bacterium]MDD5709372.1 hypothetical protein [Candidatus Neomarinimicrobiota bacterium]MDX9778103.1 hypothetical protein [bacterium]